MKKLLALLLSISLVIGCCSFTTMAGTVSITPQLQTIIDNSEPNDIISVEIFYKGNFKSVDEMPSWPNRDAATKELNAYADEIQSEYQAVIFDGIEVSNINYYQNAWMIDVDVKVSDIKKIAETDLVKKIYFLDKVEGVPEASVIDSNLQTVIDEREPEDIISIEIFYKGNFKSVDEMPSWPDRDAATKELNAYADEVQSEYQAVIFDGIEVSNNNYYQNAWMIDVDVKVSDIKKIAETDLVKKIYFLDKVEGVPEASVIDSNLQTVIDNSEPNDIISVEIFYKGNFKSVDEMPSWPDRDAATKELNAYADEIQSEYQAVIFDGIEATNINYYENAYMTDATVKVKDIQKMVGSGLVQRIYYLDNTTGEPEITLCKFKFDTTFSIDNIASYKELYYQKDNNGETDWILICVESYTTADMMYVDIISNRVVCNPGLYYPFESGYGLYDVKHDVFVAVNSDMIDNYDGLAKAFDKIGAGKLLGDIDGDDDISIVDATIVQRCEVKIREYPASDEIESDLSDYTGIRYYSDFNRDGERDIIDATCIQRYLIGMSYPKNK